MTDFDREEAAFRTALVRHAEGLEPVPFRAGHRHWRAPLLIAVTVLAVVGAAAGIAGTQGHKSDPPPAVGTGLENAQWIGIRNIEVQAPADWAPKYERGRPECIQLANDATIELPLAKRGYVVIGNPNRTMTMEACIRKQGPDDPDPAFGALPFPLWQPYVKVVEARPDLATQVAGYRDVTLEYRGWRLTRKTFDGVQVSVLSAPGDDGLGATVMESVRRMDVNHLGCAADSSVLDRPDLDAAPLPKPADVSAVVVCDYVTYQAGSGLAGSRKISGTAAHDLVEAIQDAPAGPGPGKPETCRNDPLDRALVLRFLDTGGKAVTEAYVYFDSCIPKDQIVVPGGSRQLTRDDCAPLFTDPPIGFFEGSAVVFEACHPPSG